jgi:hypothetical protein
MINPGIAHNQPRRSINQNTPGIADWVVLVTSPGEIQPGTSRAIRESPE